MAGAAVHFHLSTGNYSSSYVGGLNLQNQISTHLLAARKALLKRCGPIQFGGGPHRFFESLVKQDGLFRQ